MELKTYRAKTIHEALALVRRDLGPDAAVLGTREVRGSGGMLAWLRGDRLIEVTASTEARIPSRLPQRRMPTPRFAAAQFASVGGIDLEAPLLASEAAPADPEVDAEPPTVEPEPHLAQTAPATGPALPWLLRHLIAVGTPEDFARELVGEAMRSLAAAGDEESKVAHTHLITAMSAGFDAAGPLESNPRERRLAALIGPTGVGKTTTIAKLAAHFRLHEQRRVGLITIDTYRIAAVEQLRTYADILDVPLEVASTAAELSEAIHRLADCDLILLDTAGFSPRDQAQLEELTALLEVAQPDEIHLVLSCATGAATFATSLERFAMVGANRLILTKLDEAQCLGTLLPALHAHRLPLSYLTGGQNVPDDIEIADPVRLSEQILGSREAFSP